MFLLDTNVVSEAMIREPHPAVSAWLDAQVAGTLFLSSITVAELGFGVRTLPAGKRKSSLAAALDDVLAVFAGCILPFDMEAAWHYAELAAQARRAGKGFPNPDGYIAAIATAHGLAVASRDTSAFRAAGVAVIDPWTGKG